MYTSRLCKTVVWAALLSLLFTLAAGSTNSTCEAVVTLNTTYPSHAFYLYNDIVVENVGPCAIISVEVDITLPPGDTAFATYNITNTTGELTGLTTPMFQGSVQVGGTIVLNSERTPLVTLKSVECLATCTPVPAGSAAPSPTSSPAGPSVSDPAATSPPSTNSSTLELNVHNGSNANYISLSLLSNGEALTVQKVSLKDAATYVDSWHPMDEESWESGAAYSFSPADGPLSLPLSVRVTTVSPREVFVMRAIITSFSPAVIDSGFEYQSD